MGGVVGLYLPVFLGIFGRRHAIQLFERNGEATCIEEPYHFGYIDNGVLLLQKQICSLFQAHIADKVASSLRFR